MKKRSNRFKAKKNRNIWIILCIVLMVISIGVYRKYNQISKQKQSSNILDDIVVLELEDEEEKSEKILKLEELKKEYNEIVGWIEIDNTNINYPVMQGSDNDYYLTHNYESEEITGGSIFLDKNYDFEKPSENLLVYGHRNTSGIMFEDLTKYLDENFYNENRIIKFTTLEDDSLYEIISVFKSRVYYKSEVDVFRYYFFVDAEDEDAYNEYVENCLEVSLYDAEIIPVYGEQLLTLSTCEYSVDNGRLVVVAKKIND